MQIHEGVVCCLELQRGQEIYSKKKEGEYKIIRSTGINSKKLIKKTRKEAENDQLLECIKRVYNIYKERRECIYYKNKDYIKKQE